MLCLFNKALIKSLSKHSMNRDKGMLYVNLTMTYRFVYLYCHINMLGIL